MKAVLPAIAPELNYGNLEIQAGGMAADAYLECIAPATTPECRQALHDALLAYCERDTWGLVMIARFFIESATINADMR